MKTNRILMAVLVAGTTLMGLSRPASASVETFTAAYGSSADPLVLGGPDLPASLTLQKFNTSLGQLTDIEILLTTDVLLQADVFNAGGASVSFSDAQATATLTLTAPGGAAPTVTLATPPFGGSVGAGASVSSPQASLGAIDLAHIASADFAAYEFTGGGGASSPLEVNLMGTASYVGTGPVNLFFGGSASTFGTVEIEYQYSTVPDHEALWADLGILICGFAGFKRTCRCQ
jgi:hypothetical protein